MRAITERLAALGLGMVLFAEAALPRQSSSVHPNTETRANSPLVLGVKPLRATPSVEFPYDVKALETDLVAQLRAMFTKSHRVPWYDVKAADAPGAKPTYILNVEIIAWESKKYPLDVQVQDEVTDAQNWKQLFSETDTVLQSGSNQEFPGAIAQTLAGRIFDRFASRSGDPRPAPKGCLTPGCEALTLAYTADAIARITILAASGTGGSQGSGSKSRTRSSSARRTRVSRASSSRRPPGILGSTLDKLDRDSDQFGYIATKYQERFIEHTLGMEGCYDATQRPKKEQMKILDGVVAQLKQNYYRMPNFYWTVLYMAPEKECLNSSSLPQLRTIFPYTSLMNALHWNRDQIAAAIAHEAGHLEDHSRLSIEAIGVRATGLGMLEQGCEKHADNIGIQYAVGGGFTPIAFANMFATLENAIPEKNIARITSTHPINRDRIDNVNHALEALCKDGTARACSSVRPAAANSPAKAGSP